MARVAVDGINLADAQSQFEERQLYRREHLSIESR
jgi:hypothetical protein